MNPIIKNCYYLVRPFVPIKLRWFLQQKMASRIDGFKTMPTWPLPGTEIQTEQSIWPDSYQSAFILTHDVDTQFCFDNIRNVCEVEKKLGFRSSWNIVPNLYKIDPSVIDFLLESDMEIGVHDWNHDGRLFSDKKVFDERIKKINGVIEEWGVEGFRSGMVFHHDVWMQDLKCGYDSSYYDTDPYQPMGGGCSRITPFRLGDLMELPYTMPQDHVLFVANAQLNIPPTGDSLNEQQGIVWKWIQEYLQEQNSQSDLRHHRLRGVDIWKMKAQWLFQQNGMILMLTHPGYLCHPKIVRREKEGWLIPGDADMIDIRRREIISEHWYDSLLEQYAAFLLWFKREFDGKCWHVLPKELAQFWEHKLPHTRDM